MITLPWSVLVGDNHKHVPARGRLILTKEYRHAKASATTLVGFQWKAKAFTDRVKLTVVLYEPDRRRRDLTNYGKCLQDVMTGVVYVDDSQIDDVRFVRGPLDKANPRAEITVESL